MSKSFLTRSFSNREKALIAVLVVLLLVAFYYFLVIRNVAQTQEANAIELEEVQMQIDVQNAVASARTSMQSELEELGTLENMPMVATYDNLR
ncbi:MAG: type II secretion system protein GspM, partial [Raoultibacter sp.]